ncbi:transcription factor bHLH35-like [Dioscorea cayenensis subsp. rotundata]|uniref:Transcription factor bHLH35-like n=1 Tax=Dioscorea cayennensis subsp. rotundata TaxID=55577 RepID=A0AB40BI34_DIOCR|nr:transcription factor bHLH35-like [Dioscorea cayenensis subsp. rotundata]
MFNVLLHLSVTSVEAAPEKAGCDKITTMERSDMKEKDSSSSQTVKKDMGCMERNRREKMTEYFSTLQSIVPNLFPKATRTRVIDETISYIKRLEETVIALETTKASIRQHDPETETTTATATAAAAGAITQVLQVFEKHNAEVLSCSVTTQELNKLLISLTVLLPDLPASFLRIKDDLLLII